MLWSTELSTTSPLRRTTLTIFRVIGITAEESILNLLSVILDNSGSFQKLVL
jgi:hypothetical protein